AASAWIDSVAADATAVRDQVGATLPDVIAHCDWAARNIRLGPDPVGAYPPLQRKIRTHRESVVAIYDCDSLALLPEAEAVGMAACTWGATGASGTTSLADA